MQVELLQPPAVLEADHLGQAVPVEPQALERDVLRERRAVNALQASAPEVQRSRRLSVLDWHVLVDLEQAAHRLSRGPPRAGKLFLICLPANAPGHACCLVACRPRQSRIELGYAESTQFELFSTENVTVFFFNING